MSLKLLASLPVVAAASGTLGLTWKDCGDATHGHTTALSPDSITLGQKTTITGSGSIDEAVSGGTYNVKVSAGGFTLINHSGDICKPDTIKLPLGTGELDWKGMSCPVSAGALSVAMDATLSSYIPSSMAKTTIELTGTGSNGDDLLCLSLNTAPKSEAQLFEEFTQKFGKVYEAEGLAKRFAVFVENIAAAAKLSALDGAVYSHLTPFADLTVEEFAARNTLSAMLFDATAAPQDEILHSTASLPTAFDWREKGAVNAVKNQGSCGSCWAFSTVANIEGVNFIHNSKLLSLSEQELVDCDKVTGDQGCNGGLPSNAFKDMIANNIGLELESAYAYNGKDGQCQAVQSSEQVFISGWKQISTDEDQIAAALIQYGPLSIGINAGMMQLYFGGVADPWKALCNPKKLDHGVAIVGFGEDKKSYWTIRNSWGASWGEKGYYRIVRGKGSCGLNNMVTTATMDKTTVNV